MSEVHWDRASPSSSTRTASTELSASSTFDKSIRTAAAPARSALMHSTRSQRAFRMHRIDRGACTTRLDPASATEPGEPGRAVRPLSVLVSARVPDPPHRASPIVLICILALRVAGPCLRHGDRCPSASERDERPLSPQQLRDNPWTETPKLSRRRWRPAPVPGSRRTGSVPGVESHAPAAHDPHEGFGARSASSRSGERRSLTCDSCTRPRSLQVQPRFEA